MGLNYLYKFDANLLINSKIENGILKCSSAVCELARQKISKRDSLLFDQINKIKNDCDGLFEILCVLDFSDFMFYHHKMNELSSVKEIELRINKLEGESETEKEEVIYVTDFLKSNSMSKECQVYYINSRILSKNGMKLADEIRSRVFFDFDKNETILSKLYAYSGTVCSDCTLLHDIKLNEDEVVVIDDKVDIVYNDCITMISMDYIFDKFKKIKGYLKSYPENSLDDIKRFSSYAEMESIINGLNNSKNIISQELRGMIIKYSEICKDNIDSFKKGISELLDYYSYIGTKSNSEVKWERIEVEKYPFSLNIFDGEGLISTAFCDEIRRAYSKEIGSNKYDDSTSFQIRLPYVKGMVHTVDIKGFFEEKGITEIKNVIFNDGKKYDINKIKMILTESQFKLEGFIKNDKSELIHNICDYIKLINLYNYSFGVINANQKEKNKCSLEYQFISTLPLEGRSIRQIVSDTKHSINDDCSKENIIEDLKNEDSYWSKKELDIFEFSEDFYCSTRRYKNRKRKVFNRLKTKAIFSKFDVNGSRRYLSADLLELLYFIADIEYPENERIFNNYFYMPSIEHKNNKCIFLRSPHYSRNEIALLSSVPELNGEREKYFSKLTGVVMINPRSLVAERLGGADFDGDTVLVVNDKNVVTSMTNQFIKYENNKITYTYLPCKIPSLKGKTMSYLDYNNRLLCFQNTFSSRVGRLSNEALKKASIIYAKNSNIDHSLMAEYTILNGLEIDSAKTGKKPDITFEKDDEDELYTLYLKAKREYDNSEPLNTLKVLLSKLNNTEGIYYYDDHLDKEEDFVIDDKETNYGLNILNIVYCINYNVELFNKEEFVKTKINVSDKPKDYVRALAIASIYSSVNKIIRNVLANKAKSIKTTYRNKIYKQLKYICSKNNVDVDNLISSIGIDNIEAVNLLNTYVTDSTYHYLKDYSDKITYLKQLFVDVDEATLDMMTKFNNEGYRVVFLLINYFLNKVTRVQLTISETEREKLLEKQKELNKKDKVKFMDLYNQYENGINEILIKSALEDEETVKEEIVEYLSKEAEQISLNDIDRAIDIYESNMIFDVFANVFKKAVVIKNETE